MNAPSCLFVIYIENSSEGVGAGLPRARLPPTDDLLGSGRGERAKANSLCPSLFLRLLCLSTLEEVIRPDHVPRPLSSGPTPVSFHPWPQRARCPSCLKLHLPRLFQSWASPSYQLHPHLNHSRSSSLRTCSSLLYPKDGGFLLLPFCHGWISKIYWLHTVYLSPTAVLLLLPFSLELVRVTTYHLLATS